MEKIKQGMYLACFSCASLSLFFTLLSAPWQRYGFYYACYFALLGLILERRHLRLAQGKLAYAVILVGLVKIVSTLLLYRHQAGVGMGGNQLDAGKKLLLGGLCLLYLSQCAYHLSAARVKQALLVVSSLALLAATLYGLWQFAHNGQRVELSNSRATIAAYLYSTLSLLTIYLLTTALQPRYARLLAPLAIVLSFSLIVMTGTRAAILAHLLLLAAMMLFHYRRIHLKPLLVMALLLIVAVAVAWKSVIGPKINQTLIEVAHYEKGDDRTSLGSRFSLWAVGLQITEQHPLGITREARLQEAKDIVARQPQNRTALRFIDVHLHNELLEAASLQGVFGLLAMLLFYGSLLVRAVTTRSAPLLAIGGCMMVYGLTDVMMISQESLMFFITALALFVLLRPAPAAAHAASPA